MQSRVIRQSFLDFFREKGHTIVPSASLLPESPDLLFTNAGMNQFVPYFLGTQRPPFDPPRAANTQKCIRAGGKHNDLEDVGYDTYHHTFFEMLGNWSFGDYFKHEAIEWAWELLVGRWGLPPARLYATVYQPGPGDPGEFDTEASAHWTRLFRNAGLDPGIHVVGGNRKDNFWMMGETGPCGPCSEIHMDLTPAGDSNGRLVNLGDARCIEIWNLVFIQYNAGTDGSFRPLPACHVDTGMGFERICSILQGTQGLAHFEEQVSNYDTDVFHPIFTALTGLSGLAYCAALPEPGRNPNAAERNGIAFRVIADHLRTLAFSIADGIPPGNKNRNYVLRRILRRAVRYGRTLGLGSDGKPFLSRLAPTLVAQMSPVFPELEKHSDRILDTLDREERSFNRTLDRGLALFQSARARVPEGQNRFPAAAAFDLYHTYGFPIDLTNLMAREEGLEIDHDEVRRLLEAEQQRSAMARQVTILSAQSLSTPVVTEFTGFEEYESPAHLLEIHEVDGILLAVVDRAPFYVEKGGQVGDTGTLIAGADEIPVLDAYQIDRAIALQIPERPATFQDGVALPVLLRVDADRRSGIEAHHTATHLLHWALHEQAGTDIAQQGSLVAPDRLRFDFNSAALTPDQIARVEEAVNARIIDDAEVSWSEVPYADVKSKPGIMQFFGDKYGDRVRVVQIGGHPGGLDGYSMELCGGTHVRRTGRIGLFKIRSEGAISAGVRRIEALCGQVALRYVDALLEEKDLRCRELEEKLLAVSKQLEKERSAARAREADSILLEILEFAVQENPERPVLTAEFSGDAALLQELLNSLKKRNFPGVAVLAVRDAGSVHLGIFVSEPHQERLPAGRLMQELSPLVNGRGGGKPGMARGAGDQPEGIPGLLQKAREVLTTA